jgi:hypothetical protein
MGEFYLLEMMRTEQQSRLNLHPELALKHPIAKWCDDVDVAAMHDEHVRREAPRVFELLLHIIASEAGMVSPDPITRGKLDALWQKLRRPKLNSTAEERQWLHDARGTNKAYTWSQISDPILEAGQAREMTLSQFLELAERVFTDARVWDEHQLFGGNKWASVTKVMQLYDVLPQRAWLDQVFSLQHNGGYVFEDKVGAEGVNWFTTRKILDLAYATSNPMEMLQLLEHRGVRVPRNIARLVQRGANIGLWPPAPIVAEDSYSGDE